MEYLWKILIDKESVGFFLIRQKPCIDVEIRQ